MKIKVRGSELNLRCILFGHKVSDTTDSGFCYCKRCSAHEWYSYENAASGGVDEWAVTIPAQVYGLISRFKSFFKKPSRCSECGKINYMFGRWVGDHDKCNLPF